MTPGCLPCSSVIINEMVGVMLNLQIVEDTVRLIREVIERRKRIAILIN